MLLWLNASVNMKNNKIVNDAFEVVYYEYSIDPL